jgi:hypothetical protein
MISEFGNHIIDEERIHITGAIYVHRNTKLGHSIDLKTNIQQPGVRRLEV